MGHVSPKKIIGTKNGLFSRCPFLAFKTNGLLCRFCAGCPLAPSALNDTLLRLVKSPLWLVPRIAAEEESETTPETENKSNQ
jgi:hypothetical protein